MAAGEVATRDDNRVPVGLLLDKQNQPIQQRGTAFGGSLMRADANEHYRAYQEVLPANTDWGSAVHIDVGTDLQAKYGSAGRIRATSCVIVTDSDIQVRFNGLTEDEIQIDLINWGRIFELKAGDLGIYDLYFANYLPSGAAPEASVFIFVSG